MLDGYWIPSTIPREKRCTRVMPLKQKKTNICNEYPENNIGLKGWKEMSVTEARWPRSTATGSGGGLLLILCSSLWSTWTELTVGFPAHLYWLVKSKNLNSLPVTKLLVLECSKFGLDRIHILSSSFILCSFHCGSSWRSLSYNSLNHNQCFKHSTFT